MKQCSNLPQKKRCRGIVLTDKGIQKFQNTRYKFEFNKNNGKKYTLEEISDLTMLSVLTIRKVLQRTQGVDKQTIAYLFAPFDLHLEETDYTILKSNFRDSWDTAEVYLNSEFYGREKEISILEKWLIEDRCKLIGIVGMPGIGKTNISIKLGQRISDKFDCVIWRNMKYEVEFDIFLDDIIFSIIGDKPKNYLQKDINQKTSLFLKLIQEQRCLIILDDIIKQPNCNTSLNQYGNRYVHLLELIGRYNHQSSLLFTARKKNPKIELMEKEKLSVKLFHLKGLSKLETKKILEKIGINGTDHEFDIIARYYDGNPFAIKTVGFAIRGLFNSYISKFLQNKTTIFGDFRHILEEYFHLLSEHERDILLWLAIHNKSLSISELYRDLISPLPKYTLIEALQSLKRAFLIEQENDRFMLRPLLMDYLLTYSAVPQSTHESLRARTLLNE